MKTLKESILDDMEDVIARGDKDIRESVKKFLCRGRGLIRGFCRCGFNQHRKRA